MPTRKVDHHLNLEHIGRNHLQVNIKNKSIVARFLALVTTMVTKVDHGNYGWLPRLVTMVSYLGYQGANYGY